MIILIVLIVYDQIIGLVDFTNIYIFGITCALAWQLPHKTIFLDKQSEQPPEQISKISIADRKNDRFFDAYYNRTNYYAHNMNSSYYDYLKKKQTLNRPPSNSQNRFDDWQKYRTNKIRWNYSHDVYPALRMRRHLGTNNQLNGSNIHADVKQFLKYHRDTRFSLYNSIEKYLTA